MYGGGNTTDVFQEQEETVATETDEEGRGLHALLLPLLLVALIVTTNGLSLAAFAVEKRLRGYNNYFIINLAISDFLFGIVLIIPCLHTYLGHFPLPGDAWCSVYNSSISTVQFVANLIIVTICIDRHRATYDPIGHFTTRSKRKAIYANIAVWVASLLLWFSFSTIPEFILGYTNSSGCLPWYVRNPTIYFVTICMRFVVPFIIILVLYIRIFVKIQQTTGRKHIRKEFVASISQSGQGKSEQEGEEDGTDMEQRPQNTKEMGGPKVAKRESASEVRSATKTLLFVAIAFFITWLPMCVVTIGFSIDPAFFNPRLPSWLYLVPLWLVYVNSLLNPLCYVVSQPLFRKTVFGLISNPIRYCRG
ncbi:muscarinic acetylcholine receptor M4-like [Lytechinus variegatus]|uniref:muscarinic acetylcholine receptor M4-like n=1 Tax=Lytechinus variegatus TaxID=7654 RepID=UPI001BB2697A|nr:muscarinic acetylcholine receptor M4-like [Lytechinus variegatus]